MTPAFIGIDWGTTHRRATLIAADGTLVSERADGEGALACKGRFRASLEALIADWPEADAMLPVVMAGPHRLWVFRNDPAHEWMLASPPAPAPDCR